MSVFSVIFNKIERVSSDAAVGTHPVENTTVVQPLHQATVATVEADNAADAEHAVRSAYNGSTSSVHVIHTDNVEVAPFEKAQEQARKEAQAEQDRVAREKAEAEQAERERVDAEKAEQAEKEQAAQPVEQTEPETEATPTPTTEQVTDENPADVTPVEQAEIQEQPESEYADPKVEAINAEAVSK